MPLLSDGFNSEKILPCNRKRFRVPYFGATSDHDMASEMLPESDEHTANVWSSLCEDGLHRPLLDVDKDQWFGKINNNFSRYGSIEQVIDTLNSYGLGDLYWWESSTPGNFHVSGDFAMPWRIYVLLLRSLAWQEHILQPNYVDVSVVRMQTVLRLPGVTK